MLHVQMEQRNQTVHNACQRQAGGMWGGKLTHTPKLVQGSTRALKSMYESLIFWKPRVSHWTDEQGAQDSKLVLCLKAPQDAH